MLNFSNLKSARAVPPITYMCRLVADLSSVVCRVNGLTALAVRNDGEENSCIS